MKQEWMSLGAVTMLALVIAMLCAPLVGCIGTLTGIKEYRNGDTDIKFVTGADFGLSFNGTDTVDNRRGIQPDGGYGKRTVKVRPANLED